MYAVIKTGGKQYRVAAGEKIKVEQVAASVPQKNMIELPPGATFDPDPQTSRGSHAG